MSNQQMELFVMKQISKDGNEIKYTPIRSDSPELVQKFSNGESVQKVDLSVAPFMLVDGYYINEITTVKCGELGTAQIISPRFS